jgi:hypothetical protein
LRLKTKQKEMLMPIIKNTVLDADWVVHVLGPDDVMPQPDELTALRVANDTNKMFAKMVAEDPSPNWPHCWAVVKNRRTEEC